MPQRIVEQGLPRLGARVGRIERLDRPLLGLRLAPWHPGHRPRLQEGFANRLGLLLFALQLQLVRLLRPLVAAGGARGLHRRFADLQAQEVEQRVRGIGLDDGQRDHRPRHRDVQRVDIELEQLERLVALVAPAPVFDLLACQIVVQDAVTDLAEGCALTRHQLEQQDVLVFQPLGLVHREHQRRAEPGLRRRLVLVAQHDHRVPRRLPGRLVQRPQRRLLGGYERHAAFVAGGAPDQETALAVDRAEASLLELQQAVRHLGHAPGVAVIRLQHVERLSLRGGTCKPVPEQRLHRRPAEEVRVDDLVAVATQQELAGLLQRRQHQRQLNRCQVLHLVDHDEIETDVGQGGGVVAPRVRNQVTEGVQARPEVRSLCRRPCALPRRTGPRFAP